MKFFAKLAGSLSIAMIAVILLGGGASGVTFNSSRIIDDSIFDNVNSMNASQINAFLNGFSGSCLSTNNGFTAPDPTGYNHNQGYLYGSPVSAGQVIYDASQAYSINPQVILSTLQKEEGTVVGNGPYGCTALALSAAAGYACTDSDTASHTYTYTNGTDPGTLSTPLFYSHGSPVNSVSNTCVNSSLKAGFTEQVIRAAWLLKFGEQRSEGNISWAVVKGNWDNSDDPQSCYGGPMTQGTFARCPSGGASYYDGYTPIDGTSTHMDDGATAALYWYTPHFSGNQDFFNIFTNWFGSTTILPELLSRYNALASSGTSMGAPNDDGYCVDDAHTSCWQSFQNGYIVYNKNAGAWESYGSIRTRWGQLNYQNGEMGFPDGPVTCGIKNNGCYQQYQNGYIVGSPGTGWWESMGSIRNKWSKLSFENGSMGYPTGGIFQTKPGGYYQQYQNGYIVGSNATGWWASMYGAIRDRWGALGFQDGRLGFPTADQDCTQPGSGCQQNFQGGTIFWTSATGAWQTWGAIAGRYYQLGNDSSSLGYPVDAEKCGTIKNNGCFQPFQNGYIVGSPNTGWWESMSGPVRDRWGALKYENGRLGYPTSGLDCAQPNSGCVQHFQGGTIFWTSATGAWQTWGAIAGRYYQLGNDSSSLGYPVDAEKCGTIKNNGCFQPFQNGYIVGSPNTGWWESMGPSRERWGQLGYENGELGYPTGSLACTLTDSGCFQAYQHGFIVGTTATGYWESFGKIRDKWASLNYENGVLGYPTGAVSCASGTCSQTYQHGTIFSNNSTAWYTSS